MRYIDSETYLLLSNAFLHQYMCNCSALSPRKAQGPFVLKLLDYFHTIYVTCMVTELMREDLNSYLQKFPTPELPLGQTYTIAIQLSTAISFLVNHGILHRDLHTKNILLELNNKAKQQDKDRIKRLALTDFGLSTLSASRDAKSPVPLTGHVYVSAYRAPEIFMYPGTCFTKKGTWCPPSHIPYSLMSYLQHRIRTPSRVDFYVCLQQHVETHTFCLKKISKLYQSSGFQPICGQALASLPTRCWVPLLLTLQAMILPATYEAQSFST